MPSIWSYSDYANRGYGLFKRRIFEAMRKQGWTTILAEASLLETSAKSILREHLFHHPAEWILLINQSAEQFYEYLEIPRDRRPFTQKKIVWYLDDPRFFVTKPFEKHEYVFCFDKAYVDSLRPFQPRYCGFLPLAADMMQSGKAERHLTCEICFVGGVIDQSERRSQLSEEMKQYVDRIVEYQLEHRERSFQEIAEEIPIAPGKQINIPPQVAHYLYWEANNRYRLRVLESLRDYDLRIYGNEDWERLLQDSPLRENFRGLADPVKELPHLFASASINLNIHSIQCRGSLNQRDFNAPIAGGFLLSDWTPAAGLFFQPGVEAIYWSGIRDLRAKVAYYLSQETERNAVALRGRQRVLAHHTYDERVMRMLRVIYGETDDLM
ncbi:MAG: hypothetical protein C4527_29130 [Candidatus Omnitrophota bacterium]|nr:MAG: hypothetical protein C4527_29130 [Candidatus Omnitrophota bacterium]